MIKHEAKTKGLQIQAYYERDAISQSYLKALERGIVHWKKEKERYFSEEPHLDEGSGLDVLLLTPELFDDQFFVSDTLAKPGKGALSVIRYVFDEFKFSMLEWEGLVTQVEAGKFFPDNDVYNAVLEGCDRDGYGGSWKPDRKVKDVVIKGNNYMKDLHEADGRTVLSSEQMDKIRQMKAKLKNHEITGSLVSSLLSPSQSWHESAVLIQEPIYFNYKNAACKALPDLVYENNDDSHILGNKLPIPKESIQPFEIKTVGSVFDFEKSYRRFRYDVQEAWYHLALSEKYPDYTILPMFYIVVSGQEHEHPLIYKSNVANRMLGKYGANWVKGELEIVSSNVPVDIPGFEQMLDRHFWHLTDDQWEYDREVVEGGGILDIDVWRSRISSQLSAF